MTQQQNSQKIASSFQIWIIAFILSFMALVLAASVVNAFGKRHLENAPVEDYYYFIPKNQAIILDKSVYPTCMPNGKRVEMYAATQRQANFSGAITTKKFLKRVITVPNKGNVFQDTDVNLTIEDTVTVGRTDISPFFFYDCNRVQPGRYLWKAETCFYIGDFKKCHFYETESFEVK